MAIEDYRLQIPQYLSGELTGDEKRAFEKQLDSSAELREELEELRSLWSDLALLPDVQPSLALRARFYQRLNALERDRPAPSAWTVSHRFWPQLAAAVLLFAAGLWLGRMNFGFPAQSGELASMHAQVQNLRELVALSLLDRQSAASRLEGVAWSSRIERPNDEVVQALLTALNHDANVNVRLSSVNALERFTGNATVGKALVDSIEQQDSPLVQIALIDSLVNVRNRTAAAELKRLTAVPGINPAVRQRAQWAFQKLTFE